MRPAWPRVMSYPALTEKPVVGGPMSGAERMGPPYGPLRERGGAGDCMEVKATAGTGLEKPPGANAETPGGLGRD